MFLPPGEMLAAPALLIGEIPRFLSKLKMKQLRADTTDVSPLRRGRGHLTTRLEYEFRHDHFPGVAFYGVVILRIRSLTAPPGDGPHFGGAATGAGRRFETSGETPHHRTPPVEQLPASLTRDASLKRIAR